LLHKVYISVKRPFTWWGGLNRGIFDVRLAAVLLVFLVGSVSLISVNQRAEANGAVNTLCSSCSSSDVRFLNAIFLEGEEKDEALATALNSRDYLNVKDLFPESVYTAVMENVTAQVADLEFNGTRAELLIVIVPFRAETISASIIFAAIHSAVLNQTMAIGGAIDLQKRAPILLKTSVEGKVNVTSIPLTRSSSCSSCSSCSTSGSGASPMDVICYSDDICLEFYGPWYCCVDYQCVLCPPPPPPPSGCKVMDDYCYNFKKALCLSEFGVCMTLCFATGGNPLCFAACLAYYYICLANAYYDCCLEWW